MFPDGIRLAITRRDDGTIEAAAAGGARRDVTRAREPRCDSFCIYSICDPNVAVIETRGRRRVFVGCFRGRSVAADRRGLMFNGFGVLIVILLFAIIVLVLDKLGQRKERRSKDRAV